MNDPDDQLAILAENMHAPLLLYARQWLESEAEDIVQEAFLRLLRVSRLAADSPEKEAIENPPAWLFRVVRNEAISRLRRRALMGRYAENLWTEGKPWFDTRPEKKAEAEEIAEKIAAMPMELREVLVPRLWGGLSFQEIGELTETSQSTAHRRYHEALYYLREQFR